MITTTRMATSIEPVIQQRPALIDVVKQATALLEAEYVKGPPPRTPADVSLSWSLTGFGDEEFVKVRLEEREQDGSFRRAERTVPLRHLFDPVNREIWMIRVLGDVLSKRSDESMSRIDQIIRDLEREEQNGSEVAH